MCCEQDIGVAGPDYETEVWIGPAHTALLNSTLSSEGTLAAFDGVGPIASDITTSKYQQVCDRLHSIKINRAKLDMTDRPGQEKEEDDTSNTMQQEVSAQENSSSPDERQERQDTRRVSTDTGVVDVEVGTLAAQIAQVNAGILAAQVTPSGQRIQQVFTPQFYQRLPRPLSHLLKELPLVDGTVVKLLCDKPGGANE